MIFGIGQDLIETNRVLDALRRERFRTKYFTAKELEMAKGNDIKLVGNFAVKEAVSKVFGTGFSSIVPIDIEVLRDSYGKPYVNLYGSALQLYQNLELENIYVTISNTKEYTSAVAVGECKNKL